MCKERPNSEETECEIFFKYDLKIALLVEYHYTAAHCSHKSKGCKIY